MEKQYLYDAPSVTITEIRISRNILTGSAYGEAGKAGSDLDILDELIF